MIEWEVLGKVVGCLGFAWFWSIIIFGGGIEPKNWTLGPTPEERKAHKEQQMGCMWILFVVLLLGEFKCW